MVCTWTTYDFRLIYDEETKNKLVKSMDFKVKEADVEKWLGMYIKHDIEADQVSVSMTIYIESALKTFNMDKCKAVRTPVEPNTKLLDTEVMGESVTTNTDTVKEAEATKFP